MNGSRLSGRLGLKGGTCLLTIPVPPKHEFWQDQRIFHRNPGSGGQAAFAVPLRSHHCAQFPAPGYTRQHRCVQSLDVVSSPSSLLCPPNPVFSRRNPRHFIATDEEDKHISPIMRVNGALDVLLKCLETKDAEEFGLALTTCTNLCAGEQNGSIFFEDGRMLKHALDVLTSTDKSERTTNEQQIRDISMLCLSNFSVNSMNTTRMSERGVLPHVIKAFKDAPQGLERHHAVKALAYLSSDGTSFLPSFLAFTSFLYPTLSEAIW